jgi:ClpP class serine protease
MFGRVVGGCSYKNQHVGASLSHTRFSKEDLQKSKEDLEQVYVLFRDFVAKNRPQLNINEIATGETWFGSDALDRKLCT